MRRAPIRACMHSLAALGALLGLAACGAPNPPPSPMSEIPIRAPTTPPAILYVSMPGVAPVPHFLTAQLSRGAEVVCAPIVGTRLDPVADSTFLLVLSPPGFVVTRETVLRRTVPGPVNAPELAMDGANNGRCDYIFRVAAG
ncbi:hypothetical protein J8J14_02570 [Roseomonas sp. SSH11]|uniref:Lipoprotein n=1 Tax=Pararoseomonas baculiformis TaxID=2820812 RepID=A0ABS4A9V1_9PROT|nr:hypothetical protein [Pararoseomonas baculiformis]MBP0443651.1 hypothetical protein [Pararoseomonas baculiformis]